MADKKPSASKKNSILAQAEAKAEKIVKDKEKAKKSAKNGKSAKKQNGFVKYFKDLKSEFKKVVWPSWGKVVNNTGVVLAFMVVSALFIWGIDSGLSALLKLALNA